ncbi:hypothetical protein CCS41_02740 [Candidatus Fukatsuia symbiotica]|uniref:Uncharacterized protein n=2 Tax=Yersiniaceae TaxID=1903411 RepID=A0A2U8I6X8_9GAMM|nr:hypothetical protein CCS41_02740 [Candidatus Fukatsuia symbiotica]
MISTHYAHAGFSETSWSFGAQEQVVIQPSPWGSAYMCKEFSPKKVSFIIRAVSGKESQFGWMSVDNVPIQEREHKVQSASTLSIDFQPHIGYHIINTTGVAIEGRQCEAAGN